MRSLRQEPFAREPATPGAGRAVLLSLEPRGLNREVAARYVGVSPSKFDQLVDDGRMPRPKKIDGRRVWDRRALDCAFDALGDDGPPNPWDSIL
jgi:predicted DNA-binding transcriptional regulator AlpA